MRHSSARERTNTTPSKRSRTIAIVVALCGVLALTACGPGESRSESTAASRPSSTAAPASPTSSAAPTGLFAGADAAPDNPLQWSSERIYADAAAIYGDQLPMCEGLGIDAITIKLLQAPFAVQQSSHPAALECDYSDNVGGSRPAGQTVSATLTATIDPPKSYAAKYVYDVFSLGEPQPSMQPGFVSEPLGLGDDSAVVSTGLNFWSLAKTSSAQYGIELHVGTADIRDHAYYVAAIKAALQTMMRNQPHPFGG